MKKYISTGVIIVLSIVSVIFITLNVQNSHKLHKFQEEIDGEVQASLTRLSKNLSKSDLSSFESNLMLIREPSTRLNAIASLSSYNNQESGMPLNAVTTLLEQILRNIDNPKLIITEDQLMELQGLVKSLSEDPGNTDLIQNLYNFLVTIH